MTLESMRALVVEDDHSWQQILSEILNDCGLEVDLADDTDKALTLIRQRSHRLAVVDLSLKMDDPHNQEGLKILGTLQQDDPTCLTMLLTGFATVELAVSVLTEYSAFTCLRKEIFNRGQFREMIGRAMTAAPSGAIHAAGEPSQKAETLIMPAATTAKSALSALVVDDDAGWRSILYELLADSGIQVRLCSSFGEALSYLRREKFDLVIMDLSLSGNALADDELPGSAQDTEGYRLLASGRASGIPTLVVSGMSKPQDIEKIYEEQGIFAFIEKQSFDRRSFLHMVEEALAASQEKNELSVLTDREQEVLLLLSRGKTNKEIADTLYISTNTVKRHLKAIFSKLDIHTRSAAAAWAAGRENG